MFFLTQKIILIFHKNIKDKYDGNSHKILPMIIQVEV